MARITEEDAKVTWCPMARLMTGAEGMAAGNRPIDGHPALMCIGSACMAWRWNGHRTAADDYALASDPGAIPVGYCGLAGKP